MNKFWFNNKIGATKKCFISHIFQLTVFYFSMKFLNIYVLTIGVSHTSFI